MAMILVAALVWSRPSASDTAVCHSLRYTIEDEDERQYVSEGELSALLQSQAIYPVGKSVHAISLQAIEQTVRAHSMVRRAECYMTPRHEVRIRLTQRVPLLRVQTPVETYLIDEDRLVMPAKNAVKDSVLVVKGNVGVQIASHQLADFAEWLQDNKYWQQRVHHVYVQSPQMMYLYLRGVNQPRIVMGNMSDYKQKLAKLRTFIEHGAEATQDKHYTELDLRFKGQVVGRKENW